MAQHYRSHYSETDSICGTNMVGQRTPNDMDKDTTTCIACEAILTGRPLYQTVAVDEDGYTDRNVFNTPQEQMAACEEAFDNLAVNVTLNILSVDDLRNGEW